MDAEKVEPLELLHLAASYQRRKEFEAQMIAVQIVSLLGQGLAGSGKGGGSSTPKTEKKKISGREVLALGHEIK